MQYYFIIFNFKSIFIIYYLCWFIIYLFITYLLIIYNIPAFHFLHFTFLLFGYGPGPRAFNLLLNLWQSSFYMHTFVLISNF